MSDGNDSENFLRNEDTLIRRAWVERALQGVRRRLEVGEALPEAGDLPEMPPKPQLSVVPSRFKR